MPDRPPGVPRGGAGGVFVRAPRLGARDAARLLRALDQLSRPGPAGVGDVAGRRVPTRPARPRPSRPRRGRGGAPAAARHGEPATSGRTAPPSQRAQERLASVRARLAGSVRPSSGGAVELERGRCLDLAAELADLAEALHRQGRVVEALALEGVEARLLDALVGAGPFEPDAVDAIERR
ncbi:MAG TPA: hypothetical protein VMU75_10660 [Acidimicrobiales bacterium]|nr:hypothetical protein [Acidimicrobiales bacterium]